VIVTVEPQVDSIRYRQIEWRKLRVTVVVSIAGTLHVVDDRNPKAKVMRLVDSIFQPAVMLRA